MLTDVLGCGQRELQQLTDTSGASGHQKLRVCDVCGAYLSVLDSDRRLADHFGGKVCGMNGSMDDLKVMSRVDRCIWATTSCATCSPSFGKSERSARWRLRRPARLPEGEVGRCGQPVSVWNTGLHVTIGTGSVTEATRGTRRDMSEWFLWALGWHSP